MEFIKRLFQAMKSPGSTWTMFSTSKQEVKEMLISLGQVEIGGDFIKIENYPFEPSIAFRQSIIRACWGFSDGVKNLSFFRQFLRF